MLVLELHQILIKFRELNTIGIKDFRPIRPFRRRPFTLGKGGDEVQVIGFDVNLIQGFQRFVIFVSGISVYKLCSASSVLHVLFS